MVTKRTRVLIPQEDEPQHPSITDSIVVDLNDEIPQLGGLQPDEDGVLSLEHPDGSVTIDFNPDINPNSDDSDTSFGANLASKIDDSKLSEISESILSGIEIDEQSRKDWLETRTRGITLLALKVEEPRGDVGTTSAPLEGMSTVRHPLLLEAVVRFQATARGELLPASGPVKVRNDSTQKPIGMGHNGGPPMEGQPDDQQDERGEGLDDLAEALETDLNHFLTSTAKEYVPDTDRMLFYIGFGGDGFKKVYNCPMRRRPVSESVDAEDIIISNAATDISNCGRVTHKIKMRQSMLRRMQLLGVYRDVYLEPRADYNDKTSVDLKKEEIGGIKTKSNKPEDQDHTIYECYTEIDLDQFAPKQFKGKRLPLPYRVTIEKTSRQVLEIQRNWDEEDPQCLAKQFFVQFPFIRGLGFYGLGFIHLLGNTTLTLTAAWREMLDNGMFANFPGFIYAKQAGRQNTNQFRVAPGGGIPFEMPSGAKLSDVVMGLPYKETGPAFTGFIQHVEEIGERLGMVADTNVGEGKQNAPVGTTLALLEQQTMVIDSAFKRLHAAQVEEFALLKERFKEDPEALWRHNKKPARQWEKDQFIKALEECDLVPVSDPNNPTHLHRMQKLQLVKQLQQMNPAIYDSLAVDKRVLSMANIDSEGLLNEQPQQPQPDPKVVAAQQKSQIDQMKAQMDYQVAMSDMKLRQAEMIARHIHDKNKAAAEQNVEAARIKLEHLRLLQEQIKHVQGLMSDHALASQDRQHELHLAKTTQMSNNKTNGANNATKQ